MKSTFDKNAEKFVNLMVEKIESLSGLGGVFNRSDDLYSLRRNV